jgi:glycerophosphoryl diester phosphodiesterase
VSSTVLAIAHRGASGILPENTLPAFLQALDLGAKAIEFDVQLTRDLVPVVIHDETLERTTDGTGRVEDRTLAELLRLDAGAWFAPELAGTRIPTLEETLDALAGRATLNIELKPDSRCEALVERVLALVGRFGLLETAVFSSFEPAALELLRRRSAEARIGVLAASGPIASFLARAEMLRAVNLHPAAALVDRALIEQAHGLGLQVWVWTVNSPRRMAALAAMGVDGIFSDHPDRVASLR